MKKKLLSLVLAGAMVASTSVSAFADTTVPTKDINILENQTEQKVDVDITGNILDNGGNAKPGTISVTVPTAANFSVNAEGKLTSSEMVVTNNSDEKLIVIASKFEDSNGQEDINIIKKTEFDLNEAKTDTEKNPRGTIWLRLKGGTNNVGLTSEDNGKMYDTTYTTVKNESENYEIGKIDSRGNMRLTLEGQGGKRGTATEAIRDTFKLVLKVKRDR